MAKQKFTIQIEQSICVSREVLAEDIEQAVKFANEIASNDQLVKPKSRAWTDEWGCCGTSKVVGVYS